MKPVFRKANAETYKDFLVLARGWKITFSYVYDDPGVVDLEFDLPDVEPDEQYLAFNLAEHGLLGRRHFRDVSMIEMRMGDPALRRLPHWRAFVRGIGNFDSAYTLDEARAMVLAARAEMRIIEKAFEKK
jgi:hypothetical protein